MRDTHHNGRPPVGQGISVSLQASTLVQTGRVVDGVQTVMMKHCSMMQ
jgi:hypothetical protein